MSVAMSASASTLLSGGLSANGCLIRIVAAAGASRHRPDSGDCALHVFAPLQTRRPLVASPAFLQQRKHAAPVCFVMEKAKSDGVREGEAEPGNGAEFEEDQEEVSRQQRSMAERMARKRLERRTYLVAAVMSSLGITSMAVAAVYYRFAWQVEGGEIPLSEMFGTFALSVGAAVGMEFWARWAHRELWHASLWHMHESHHRPREGPFELNDVFAITNSVPAITLLAFGFFNHGFFPGLCFGAGLGITLYGMAYMFVHDGLVHRRFPVGPVADVPYFRKVAAAHQIHHMDKFDGVPYGLFLGPKELEEVGGLEELEKEISRRIKQQKSSEISRR